MPVIDVAMDGSSISVDGNLVSGAVDVHTTATGNSGAPIFIHLNDGVTADELLAFLNTKQANDPNTISNYGSLVFDAGVGPGENDVDTVLQPGNYLALDTAQQNPADWPHTTFSISENGSPSALPPAQQWQKSVEFKFRGPATLHLGQTIRVTNAGWVVHMMIGFGVRSKADGRQLVRLLRAGKDSQAGKYATQDFLSLFGPLSHGAVQQFALQGKAGWYVLACFMDTQDGREHTRLGMVKLVHVVS